jgi:hypothetical protein
MRISKFSCVPLLVGLAVSLLAVWVSAAPVLDDGQSVLGGWERKWMGSGGYFWPDNYIGYTSGSSCNYCTSTEWALCSDGPIGYKCGEGNIVIAIPSMSGGSPSKDTTACTINWYCGHMWHAWCN